MYNLFFSDHISCQDNPEAAPTDAPASGGCVKTSKSDGKIQYFQCSTVHIC